MVGETLLIRPPILHRISFCVLLYRYLSRESKKKKNLYRGIVRIMTIGGKLHLALWEEAGAEHLCITAVTQDSTPVWVL